MNKPREDPTYHRAIFFGLLYCVLLPFYIESAYSISFCTSQYLHFDEKGTVFNFSFISSRSLIMLMVKYYHNDVKTHQKYYAEIKWTTKNKQTNTQKQIQ